MAVFVELPRDQSCEGSYGISVRSSQQSRIHQGSACTFNRSGVMRRLVNSSALFVVALSLVACSESVVFPEIPLDALRSATTPVNNSGQCLGNDVMTWPQYVLGGSNVEDPNDLNCTANDVEVTALTVSEIFTNGEWVPAGASATCTAGDRKSVV